MKREIFLIAFLCVLFLSTSLLSQENKLRVTAERANLHIEPDIKSAVIETVERGDILTLLSKRKMREAWYYVSFFSGRLSLFVSGFISTSAVESVTVVTEVAEAEKGKPEEEREEVLFKFPIEIQVALEQATVRAEPNIEAQVIQQIQPQTTLLSLGKAGEWYKVKLPPDEAGNVLTGYIHQSFVEVLHKELEEVAELEEKEAVVSPHVPPEAKKKRIGYIKMGANYFMFSERSRRNTYGEGIDYEAEIAVNIWKGIGAWLGSRYFYKSKGGSRIKLFPVEAGVRYGLSKGMFNFYGGLGLNYYNYKESTPTLNERKEKLGYIAKLGSFVKVKKGLIVDLHLNYSYCYLVLTSQRVNIGGAEAGIGLGYTF